MGYEIRELWEEKVSSRWGEEVTSVYNGKYASQKTEGKDREGRQVNTNKV